MWAWLRPTSILNGIVIHQPIGHNRHGPRIIWTQAVGAAVPLSVTGAGSPPNTIWLKPRPTIMPSFILICSTIWPQYINVTDRTGQQSDSIGRTVL